jgi:signal transduction histidine kinase/ActR/RegA family two-component response regulator
VRYVHPVKRELWRLLGGVALCAFLLLVVYLVLSARIESMRRAQQEFHAKALSTSAELSTALALMTLPRGVPRATVDHLEDEAAFVSSVTRNFGRAQALLGELIALHKKEAAPAFARNLLRLTRASEELTALNRSYGSDQLTLARTLTVQPLYASVVVQQTERLHEHASQLLQAQQSFAQRTLVTTFTLVCVGLGFGLAFQLRRSLRGIDGILGQERDARESVAEVLAGLEQQVAMRTRDLTIALDEAEHANRAKSDFLSHMSHELRTPMNAVLGFAQLLELDPALSQQQRQWLGHILRGGNHLLQLINDLLDLARLESGRITLSREPISVPGAVHEVVELLKPLAQANRVCIEMTSMPALVVRGDRLRLRQVLLNITANAIKYNRPGGWVLISAENRDDGRVQVVVEDSGQGIAEADTSKVFEPFARLGAERGSIEGAGIGLSVTKRLVELMEGHIGVASTVGKGSRFWIELPSDLHGSARVEGLTQARSPDPESALGPAQVLYVEDNPDNLELVAHILERHPHVTLIAAPSAALGFDLACSHRPDLILLDLHLPDASGYGLLVRLREHPQTCGVPAVAVTANAMPTEEARARAAGFAGYLSKPLDVRNFEGMLRQMLKPAVESALLVPGNESPRGSSPLSRPSRE